MAVDPNALRDFAGTDRFEVISRLGSGGMGSVFHVYDRERRARMALKTVGHVDGDALLRFKREYRSLQDIDHPNLIQLGELFEVEGRWFYTMELIDGTTFQRWARPREVEAPPRRSVTDDATEVPDDTPDATATGGAAQAPGAEEPPPFDELRLRRALAQLAAGLAALHATGRVHRDIKPSNVLVSRTGRVVLLDFGLVTELRRGEQRSDVGVMGTYPYMAPEQAAGRAVGPASDWYAVGAMLFQALTGTTPFRGTTEALIYAKLHETAPEAKWIEPRVPDDLNALCIDLLKKDPEARPTAKQILERLHVQADSSSEHALGSASSGVGQAFVGRTAELAELRAAFTDLLEQRGSSVVVAGESGIGKSELVRRFLDRIEEQHPTAIVLVGRCHERESVPFRSFDGIVDALSGHLAKLPRDRIERLMPRHRGLVARVFPVLRRIDAMKHDDEVDAPDPQEKRARLFGAFRALLSKLATSDPLVLCIEDVQWMDEDSRALVEEVVRDPGAPPLFLLLTQRTPPESVRLAVEQPVIRTTHASLVALAPLADDEARSLAERLLDSHSADDAARISAIVKEARGHPLLVDQLAQHARLRRSSPELGASLEEAIRERLEALDAGARRMLEVVAISASELPVDVAARVAGLTPESAEEAVRELRRLRLLRTVGHGGTDAAEPYHGRIADAALVSVSEAEVASIHAKIAGELEAIADVDPAELARHLEASGDRIRAAAFAAEAARRAEEAMAFDRAARLYRRSLDLDPTTRAELGERDVLLARALANGGRGKEAAEAYLVAATSRTGGEAIDRRRRAAEQFLLSGHVSQGIEVLRALLRTVNVTYPDTTWSSVAMIVWTRLWLLFRNHRVSQRAEGSVREEERLRLEACHSAALGLTATDTIRGLDFYGRSYRAALEIGDRAKASQLLATDAINAIAGNGRGRRKAFRTIRRARGLAEATGDPYARGVVAYAEGMGHYLLGEWREGNECFLEADRTFRDECPEAPPEFRTLQACVLHCFFELGDYRALENRASRALREAEERGDIFTEATLRCGLAIQMHCMRGDAERGLLEATRTIETWTGTGFDMQHYMFYVHSSYALLYLGRPKEAHERMEACVSRARLSMLAWVQLMRAGAHQVRGLTAIARAATEPESRRRLARAALGDARRMNREDSVWSHAGAAVLRGNALALLGDVEEALSCLEEASLLCERSFMGGRAAACRYASGRLIGGRRGASLVADARNFLVERGVRHPDRFARNFAPLLFAPADDPMFTP